MSRFDLLLLSLFLASMPVFTPALGAAGQCSAGNQPGASLFFPYFETDLSDPGGLKTLISIQNTSSGPILTNVVVWTDCGLPVFSFNLALGPNGVRPLDVHDLVNGKIPTSDVDAFPGCAPLADLDPSRVAVIQARLTGQPDPEDGACYANPRQPATLANGYITVDVVKECSETARTPWDVGYFTFGGEEGITDSANVLWGDFFLIDGPEDQAQGFEAVALIGEPSHGRTGFYTPGDDRQRLGSRYRTRFLDGGAFDGGTEFLVWVEPQGFFGFFCGTDQCGQGGFTAYSTEVKARTEGGDTVYLDRMDLKSTASRLSVGGEELPIEQKFGTLDFRFDYYSCRSRKCTPPSGPVPIQGWLMPIYSADGRYSAGLRAVALDDPCADGN